MLQTLVYMAILDIDAIRDMSKAGQKFPIRAEQKGTISDAGREDKAHDMGAAVA
jgi:hypothetical protein